MLQLLIVALLSGIMGFVSVQLGYDFTTWQYWLITAPLAFALGWFFNDIVKFF